MLLLIGSWPRQLAVPPKPPPRSLWILAFASRSEALIFLPFIHFFFIDIHRFSVFASLRLPFFIEASRIFYLSLTFSLFIIAFPSFPICGFLSSLSDWLPWSAQATCFLTLEPDGHLLESTLSVLSGETAVWVFSGAAVVTGCGRPVAQWLVLGPV